jgi:hypothetical protein
MPATDGRAESRDDLEVLFFSRTFGSPRGRFVAYDEIGQNGTLRDYFTSGGAVFPQVGRRGKPTPLPLSDKAVARAMNAGSVWPWRTTG